MKVQLKDVRLTFPNVFEAKAVNGQGEPKFSATFLLAKNHPQKAERRIGAFLGWLGPDAPATPLLHAILERARA